jgi:hypothetical protein
VKAVVMDLAGYTRVDHRDGHACVVEPGPGPAAPLTEDELAELVDPNAGERQRWLCYRAVLEIKRLKDALGRIREWSRANEIHANAAGWSTGAVEHISAGALGQEPHLPPALADAVVLPSER